MQKLQKQKQKQKQNKESNTNKNTTNKAAFNPESVHWLAMTFGGSLSEEIDHEMMATIPPLKRHTPFLDPSYHQIPQILQSPV